MRHRTARTCWEEPNKDPTTAAAGAAVSRQLEKRISRAEQGRRNGDAAGARPSSHDGINLSPLEEEEEGEEEKPTAALLLLAPREARARPATDGRRQLTRDLKQMIS
ncbi:unnamed protein product [Urochloa humidicola]